MALARASADAQRWDRCGAAIELLQRLHPESGLAMAARGWWEVTQRRQSAALHWLDLAADAGDLSAPLLVDIAEGFLKMRKLRRAGELLARAERLDPACMHLAAARAYHALLAGNGEAAWREAKLAVESRGALPEHWRRLAEACLLRGDREGACVAFQKAVMLQPHFTAAWRRLAQLYGELGERAKAEYAAFQTLVSHVRGGGKQRALTAGFGRVLQALALLPPPCR
jgi:predicted Zn-dependent protease